MLSISGYHHLSAPLCTYTHRLLQKPVYRTNRHHPLVPFIRLISLAFRRYESSLIEFATYDRSLLDMLICVAGYPNFAVFESLRQNENGGNLIFIVVSYFMAVIIAQSLIVIMSDAYLKVHQEYVDSGEEIYSFHRINKLVQKRFKETYARIEEIYEGDSEDRPTKKWCWFIQYKLRNFCLGKYSGLGEEAKGNEADPDSEEEGPDDSFWDVLKHESKSNWELRCEQMEEQAIRDMIELRELLRDTVQRTQVIAPCIDKVDTLQGTVDAVDQSTTAIEKSVTLLATEVFERLQS